MAATMFCCALKTNVEVEPKEAYIIRASPKYMLLFAFGSWLAYYFVEDLS